MEVPKIWVRRRHGAARHALTTWAVSSERSAITTPGEVGTLYTCSSFYADISRAARTRARKLDYDQRHENALDASKRANLEAPTELDPDKAGLGMFYCVECDRHFPNSNDRNAHLASKLHKRIAKKVLTEKPYTHEEALRGAGIGVDNKQRNSDRIEAEQE